MNFDKVDLLDVCEVYQPKTIATKDFVKDGKYLVYGANGVIGKYDKFNHAESEVLMACRGATCGAINVSKPCSWINGNAMVIRPKKDIKISKRYLRYFLMTINKNELISGTAQPQITRQNLQKFQMPICDLSEQERIAARIEELFAELDKSVAALKRAKEQVEEYKESVLKNKFNNIKKESLDAYFTVSGGLTKNSKRESLNLVIPYITVANVFFNKFNLNEIKKIGVTKDEVQKYQLKRGDLLFVEGNGSKEQIGRVAVWDGSIKNCLHQNHIIKVRGNGKILPKYVMYYFMSREGRQQIVEVASSTSGLYTLSTGKIKNLKIPICEKREQEFIIECIEREMQGAQRIDLLVDTYVCQADLLRQSILKKAFEGEL